MVPVGVEEATLPPDVVEIDSVAVVGGGGGVGVGVGAGDGVGVGAGAGGTGTLCGLAPPPQATSAIRVLMVIMACARLLTLYMLII